MPSSILSRSFEVTVAANLFVVAPMLLALICASTLLALVCIKTNIGATVNIDRPVKIFHIVRVDRRSRQTPYDVVANLKLIASGGTIRAHGR
jgi:hypothetical protein